MTKEREVGGGDMTKEGDVKKEGRVCDMVYQSMLKHTQTHTHTHRYKASFSDKKSTIPIHMTLSLFFIISPFLSSCFLLYFSLNVCVYNCVTHPHTLTTMETKCAECHMNQSQHRGWQLGQFIALCTLLSLAETVNPCSLIGQICQRELWLVESVNLSLLFIWKWGCHCQPLLWLAEIVSVSP